MCNITLSSQTHNGKTYTYYSVYLNRKRHLFKSKAEAKAFVSTHKVAEDSAGRTAATLLSQNAAHIASALQLLEENGLPPSQLIDAVREYVSRNTTTHGNATLAGMASDYLAFTEKHVSKQTYVVAAQAIKLLADAIGGDKKVACINAADYVGAMRSISEGRSPTTFNSILRRLKTFARWAERNQYPTQASILDAVSKKHVHAKEPRFASLEEVDKIMDAVFALPEEDNEVKMLFFLSFYAGMRTVEILHLDKSCFKNLDTCQGTHPYILVKYTKGSSNGRRGRCVYLHGKPSADVIRMFESKWLKNYDAQTPIVSRNACRKLSKIMKDLRIEDYHNIGRHSFITYHIAKTDNEELTVRLCGTSKEMAAAHYKGLATKEQGESYFNKVYDPTTLN